MSELHRVIHSSCTQLGAQRRSPSGWMYQTVCGARATHRCSDHGDACDLHSRYSVSGPRLCDTCRKPMVRIAPVKT